MMGSQWRQTTQLRYTEREIDSTIEGSLILLVENSQWKKKEKNDAIIPNERTLYIRAAKACVFRDGQWSLQTD